MRILNSKELAGLSQVYPEGFTGRVGLMILKAQHQQDLKDFIWWLEDNNCKPEKDSFVLLRKEDIESLKQLVED